METRELRYFVALAEELHFARAAARVGIEQSPLSKAISEMERRLGVQLFIRTRQGTQLTCVGEILLEDARRILGSLDQARQNIRSAASGRRGRLRIAVSDGVAHCRIARLLENSRRDDPDIEMQIVHRPFSTQLRELCSGALDLGFALSSCKEPQLHVLELWKDTVAAIMRFDQPGSVHSTLLEATLGESTIILLGEGSAGFDSIRDWILSRHRPCGPIEYVGNMELLLTLVAAGYGVGFVSAGLAEQIRRPDLVIRPLCAREATVTTVLLRRSGNMSSLVARFTERAQNLDGQGD